MVYIKRELKLFSLMHRNLSFDHSGRDLLVNYDKVL